MLVSVIMKNIKLYKDLGTITFYMYANPYSNSQTFAQTNSVKIN